MGIIKYFGIAVMAVMLSAGVPFPAKVNAQPGVSISFQVFYNSLSPYGRWTSHPSYGSIWIPSVARDFHPYYTNGRWVMTEFGNTWVSDFDWGWAPFHYGRWFYDDYLGWAWVPDYTWGPGWVNWRTGGGYYGWAPLMPGLDIHIAVNLPLNFWIFVPQRHFMSARWHRHVVPQPRVTNIYHQTTIINNYYNYNNHVYVYGPRSSDIQKHTRSSVPVYTYSSRVANGSFRESVSRSNNSATRAVVTERERSFTNSPVVAAPSNGRSSTPNASSSRANAASTTDVTRRSSERVSTPERVEYNTGRSSSRTSAAVPAERSREAVRSSEVVTPGSSRTENRGRNEVSAPAARTRETATPPARVNSAPTPARSAPSGGRSGSREAASPARSSSSREATSPSRSSSPTRGNSGSSRSERGG